MFGRILAILCSFFGRFRANAAERPIPPIRSDDEHNRMYKEATDLISPYMRLHGVTEKSVNTASAQRDLRRGISLLQVVTTYAPGNWSAYWVAGKAFQALGELEHACDVFKRAFNIQRSNSDVAREYMVTCVELGRTDEGIFAAERAISLSPSDAGLHANLALAYLIGGRHSGALKCIDESLRLDPSDKISQKVKKVIREVMDGRRPQPKTIRDIDG